MASKTSLFVFVTVAAVAMVGLILSSYGSVGAAVSIAPQQAMLETVPHVMGASRVMRCASDLYCPPDQSCVNAECMDTAYAVSKGFIQPRSDTADPSPNYAMYDKGGVMTRSQGTENVNNPYYAYEDYSRANKLGTYGKYYQ